MSNRIRIFEEENNTHAILMTEEDFKDFNETASLCEKEFAEFEILDFLCENLHIYYRGKMWGFTDTEVREEICEELEKVA